MADARMAASVRTASSEVRRMSIQPNRVLERIVDQVDRSGWPCLEARTIAGGVGDGEESGLLRLYFQRAEPRYATPMHFWVHALREDLAARAQRATLVGAAGHALCRRQSLCEWQREVATMMAGATDDSLLDCVREWGMGGEVQAWRMLESDCRRSSVVAGDGWLVAHFWGHGAGESWWVEGLR
jgi:hypothetical protein